MKIGISFIQILSDLKSSEINDLYEKILSLKLFGISHLFIWRWSSCDSSNRKKIFKSYRSTWIIYGQSKYFFKHMYECIDWQDEAYQYRSFMKNDHLINNHNFHFFRYSKYFTDEKISDYSIIFSKWWCIEYLWDSDHIYDMNYVFQFLDRGYKYSISFSRITTIAIP